MLIDSLSTPGKKFGPIMHIIERVIFSIKKPPAYFWSKKQCDKNKFDLKIYNTVSYLTVALKKVAKTHSEEVMLATFNRFDYKQLKKICELGGFFGNIGQIVATFNYYCDQENERIKRLNLPKDETVAAPIVFDSGDDLRKHKVKPSNKQNLWQLLSNKGDINGES